MGGYVVFQFTDPNAVRKRGSLGVRGKTYATIESAEQAKRSCIDYDLVNHNIIDGPISKYRVEEYKPEDKSHA